MVEQQIQVRTERCGEVFFDKELATGRRGDVELLGQFGSEVSVKGCGSITEDAAAEVVGFLCGWEVCGTGETRVP